MRDTPALQFQMGPLLSHLPPLSVLPARKTELAFVLRAVSYSTDTQCVHVSAAVVASVAACDIICARHDTNRGTDVCRISRELISLNLLNRPDTIFVRPTGFEAYRTTVIRLDRSGSPDGA